MGTYGLGVSIGSACRHGAALGAAAWWAGCRRALGPATARTASCPSWARTRTLLIQRGRYNALNSSNLQAFTRAVSPAAEVRSASCCGMRDAPRDHVQVRQ